jgi:MtaA/CmuA family methyltransferase
MAYAAVLDDIRCAIARGVPGRVPCFPIGVMFDFHVQGYTHRQWRTDPEVMARVAAGAVRMFDYDVFMLHPDDLIEYEEMGIGVTDEEDLPPAVSRYLPATAETLASLRGAASRGPAADGRLARHLEGLAGIKGDLGRDVCLVGRIAAPFSTASLILGIEGALMLMLEDPGLLDAYMDFFLGYNDTVARLQLEAGADAIWLGDCVATSNFISVAQFERFAKGPASESSRRIRTAGGIVFYHGAETAIPHLRTMAGMPVDTINIGYGVDIADVKAAIGSRICIMGNLDTIEVLRPLDPDAVEREVGRIVRAGREGGGYIFCTGEGITHDTPVENVKAMVRAVRENGRAEGGTR